MGAVQVPEVIRKLLRAMKNLLVVGIGFWIGLVLMTVVQGLGGS